MNEPIGWKSECPCGVISYTREDAWAHEYNCQVMKETLKEGKNRIDEGTKEYLLNVNPNTKYKYVCFVCAACGAKFDNREELLRHNNNCKEQKEIPKKSEGWNELRKIANIPDWDEERKKWETPVKYYD